ncbi:MAG: hypothetical protein JWO38_3573 [Gemmataceae bacterium]|nr:hypothetical protein [Gemmataceae bacterium]
MSSALHSTLSSGDRAATPDSPVLVTGTRVGQLVVFLVALVLVVAYYLAVTVLKLIARKHA